MKKNGRIFLLADDVTFLDRYSSFLHKNGYEVFAMDNAYKFILYARELKPDVLVVDVNIPKMNGWDVVDYLKQDNKLKDTPIILLTENSDNILDGRSVNLFFKSENPNKLVEIIEACHPNSVWDVPWEIVKNGKNNKIINVVK